MQGLQVEVQQKEARIITLNEEIKLKDGELIKFKECQDDIEKQLTQFKQQIGLTGDETKEITTRKLKEMEEELTRSIYKVKELEREKKTLFERIKTLKSCIRTNNISLRRMNTSRESVLIMHRVDTISSRNRQRVANNQTEVTLRQQTARRINVSDPFQPRSFLTLQPSGTTNDSNMSHLRPLTVTSPTWKLDSTAAAMKFCVLCRQEFSSNNESCTIHYRAEHNGVFSCCNKPRNQTAGCRTCRHFYFEIRNDLTVITDGSAVVMRIH